MKLKQPSKQEIEYIWKFIRGDLSTSDFERWVYATPTLEDIFGEAFYFEIISTKFSSKDDVFQLKEKIKEFILSTTSSACPCIQLSDISVVDFGCESEIVFTSFNKIKQRGNPYWWLSVYQCCECQQSWLVAQEENNDAFYLYRLDAMATEGILKNNRWIPIFDQYEELFRIGLEVGKRVHLIDQLYSTMHGAISDLAKERPGINIYEIARLCNLDILVAEEIARKVVDEDKVHISFTRAVSDATPRKKYLEILKRAGLV